jgi:hypothetical protein
VSRLSLRTVALPPCLPLGIKDSPEGGHEVLAFGFCFGLLALDFWAFGFWMKGGFLMWKAFWKGKRLLKGK